VLPDADLYTLLQNDIKEIVSTDAIAMQFVVQPLGVAAVEQGKARAGNALNMRARPQACKQPSSPSSIVRSRYSQRFLCTAG